MGSLHDIAMQMHLTTYAVGYNCISTFAKPDALTFMSLKQNIAL